MIRFLAAVLFAGFVMACGGAGTAITPSPAPPSATATAPPSIGPTFASQTGSSAPPTSGIVPTAPPSPPVGGGSDQYEELLTHIPVAISGTCTEVDPTAAAALAIARCQPVEIVGPGGDVTYVRYATDDPLFDLLDEKLDEVGEVPTSDDPRSCAAGPTLTAYYGGGFVEGRLICAPDTRYGGEVFAWWADLRFNVVGTALIFEGSYPELYDAVLVAELEP